MLLRIAECPGEFGRRGQLQNGLDSGIVYSGLFSFTLVRHSLQAGQDQI